MISTKRWSDVKFLHREEPVIGCSPTYGAHYFKDDPEKWFEFIPHPGDLVTDSFDHVLRMIGVVVCVDVERRTCIVMYETPEMKITMTNINARSKVLKTKWSVDVADDLKTFHGINGP